MKTNSSEINLVASLVALPGKEGESREVLRGLVTPSRNDRGCGRYDMYASDHQGKFFAVETPSLYLAPYANLQRYGS